MGKIIKRIRARPRNKLLAEAVVSVAQMNRMAALKKSREEALFRAIAGDRRPVSQQGIL